MMVGDIQDILVALAGPKLPPTSLPDQPGLYAVHAGPDAWRDLGLGAPADLRPLFLGRGESTLRHEYVLHIGEGVTAQSPLRRSLAALLRTRLGLQAVPGPAPDLQSFVEYGLGPADEARLDMWMYDHLTLASWVGGKLIGLERLEAQAIRLWKPPLNLAAIKTPWTQNLMKARRDMGLEAEVWASRLVPAAPVRRGKNTFNLAEITRIKHLLQKKVVTSRQAQQKYLLDELKALGFYISDFSDKPGFSDLDLQDLLDKGILKIV